MDAHFHSNPQIEACLNQIIGTIFTVCLITGADSEAEYQSGCQVVTKAAYLLQEITMLPPDSLEDELQLLLEHILPDPQVISNFPSFQDIMRKMVHDGMTKAIDNRTTPLLGEAKAKIPSQIDEHLGTDTEPSELIHRPYVPQPIENLKYVLRNIFPNVPVCWNLDLMGLTFLAQVEDILIYLDNPEQSCPVENLIKKGWKVYVCRTKDFMFPRRLEREIRLLQRLGKKQKRVLCD